MSKSPFISTGTSRFRDAQRRRQRRRRALVAIVAALVVAAAAIIVTERQGGGHAGPVASPTPPSSSASGARPVPTPMRSPLGLPLGRPPLTLKLADTHNPVRVHFRLPPRAALLFNLDSGRVLWRRHPRTRLPIASLTKMMTGLLVVERGRSRSSVLITRQALAFQGSGVGVLPLGKRVSLTALLYGLMLPSGNDAAIALAQHVAHSVSHFVHLMNLRAAQLGLGCTRFSSPDGFNDRHNYSCAADLAVLAHADLASSRLARVVRTRSVVVPFPIKGGKLFLYNNNPLVQLRYPGITGLKTGFTDAAGRCLVVTAERHGVRLGVVLLHSPDPPDQARELLDRAFTQVYHQRLPSRPLVPSLPAPPRGVSARA